MASRPRRDWSAYERFWPAPARITRRWPGGGGNNWPLGAGPGQGEQLVGGRQVALGQVRQRRAEDEPEAAAGGGPLVGLLRRVGADDGQQVERLLAVAAEDHGAEHQEVVGLLVVEADLL